MHLQLLVTQIHPGIQLDTEIGKATSTHTVTARASDLDPPPLRVVALVPEIDVYSSGFLGMGVCYS